MNAPPPPASISGRMMAGQLAQGTSRLLVDQGHRVLREFRLADGRRADVIGLDRHAAFTIVEIKSSAADYRADAKWTYYRDYCDHFYFAVAVGFPVAILPPDVGVIVADGYGGALLRAAPRHALAAARRKALLLRFARTACARLNQITEAHSLLGATIQP